MKTKFRHSAQNNSNGKIDRQALHHFIATIFGTQKQVSPNHIDKLLERLNLKHQTKIRFVSSFFFLFNCFLFVNVFSVSMNSSKVYSTVKNNFQVGCLINQRRDHNHHHDELQLNCFLFSKRKCELG